MATYLIQEPVSMFLLGVGLLSIARFGLMYFNKHKLAKTLLSDRADKRIYSRTQVAKIEDIERREDESREFQNNKNG
jgi:hypothetical protein